MAMNFGSFASRVVATKVVATDGTGDFTSIQDAIDDLPSGGGVVYIREGTYTLTESIVLTTPNFSIIGAGKSTILTGDFSGGFIQTNVANIIIKGISFIRTGSSVGTEAALNIEGDRPIVTECYFSGDNVAISFSSNSGIVSNCVISCDGSDAYGILLRGAGRQGSAVYGNEIEGSEIVGVYISGGDRNMIWGNYIHDCIDGIVGDSGADENMIFGNFIDDCSGDCIRIEANGDRNIINGNVVRDSDNGIVISAASCNANIVTSNVSQNNTTANFTDNGTNTVSANNVTT